MPGPEIEGEKAAHQHTQIIFRNDSEHHLSAGDVDRLPRAVRGFVAGVEEQHVQHVLIVAAAFQRDFVDVGLLDLVFRNAEFFRVFRNQRLEHRRFQQVAQHQRVHGNAAVSKVKRERLGEADRAEFGGAVAGIVFAADFARFGIDFDDAATDAVAPHQAGKGAGAEEVAGEVDIQRALEVFEREVPDG